MIVVYYCFENHMSRYGTRQRSFAVSGNVHEILQGNNGITVYYRSHNNHSGFRNSLYANDVTYSLGNLYWSVSSTGLSDQP